MKALPRSVRARITLAAVVVTALVLGLASFALLRLVERELIGEAEATLDAALEDVVAEAGDDPFIDEGFTPFDSEAGPVLVGFAEQVDDVLIAEIFQPETDTFGALIIDAKTGEVIEFVDEFDQPLDPSLIPFELDEAVFESVEVSNGQFLVGAESLDGVRASVEALRETLLIIVPFVVLALGILTWWLVGRALRPVEQIRGRAQAITATTMHERVPVPDTNDEIAELAQTMNAMLERLEAGNERQRQFAADASHELRSPLSTIRAAAEIATVEQPDGRWGAVAADVLAETERMERLIADLLDLARLDDGRRQDNLVLVDLCRVARQVVDRQTTTEINIDVVAETPVQIAAVETHLERALVNLVENAARHADGRAAVGVWNIDGHAVVVVEDDGPGVAEADRQRIFERFERVNEARARDDGGAGLGLALVAAVATRHHGTVEVHESERLGGAKFVLTLPVD